MGISEKIKEIEDEIARTQKNKATNHHIGLLKGRIAKLRSQLIEEAAGGKGGSNAESFEARKMGDARVALIGFPSVGKSTLLNRVCETKSEVASYEYTTLTCVPGTFIYNGSRIQILDLPGIIEGASKGKGKGRQVISIARTADLIVLMLDATKASIHKKLLLKELGNAGIRINERKPNVSFHIKHLGGVSYTSTCIQTKGVTKKIVQELLKQRRVHHAEVLLREDVSIDQFIDIMEGNRIYCNGLFVYNKIDNVTMEVVDKLARSPNSVVLSLELNLNVDRLQRAIWDHLDLIRIYSKKKGSGPDFVSPFIVKSGSSVEDVCKMVHKDMADRFKFATVTGRSVKHEKIGGQVVGLSHILADEDVITIVHKN